MKRFFCPADKTTVTEAGPFPEYAGCMCPKCGEPMTEVAGDHSSVSDMSYVSPQRLEEIFTRASPIARAVVAKAKNVTGGSLGIETPTAFALALIATCDNPAGWRPEEILAMAIGVTRKLRQ